MEKTLRLYKIPELEEIVSVIAITNGEVPETFSEGDLYIDSNDDALFEAQSIGGELVWVQIQTESGKYYIYKGNEQVICYDSNFEPIDLSFPQNSRIAEITSFTYSATRMGNAPTISGTLMYRECLDELWTDRVCVLFNKKFYFIDKIPSSEFSGGAAGINANVDERYKHSCEFVSENKLLENVYFTNVVDIDNYQGDITKLPMQWLEFSFFGGITQFVTRLNLSLAYSGLGANQVGFRVVKDSLEPVEKKMVSISETTLKAALDLIYETWGIPYWFDGYTIHIGYSNEQQMQQAGITMPTFQYGSAQSLLSLQKSQSDDIVNRITGFGSSENIPVFYPNKNPNAIEIQYERNQTLMANYAKIANPYKTVKLEPSESVHQGVPSGSFFKFIPIQKTYNYDQFVTINTHANKFIVEQEGVPELVVSPLEDYHVRGRFFVQPYGGQQAIIGHSNAHPEYQIICKRIWVWLRDGDLLNLSFKDKMDATKLFDTGASQILFNGEQNFYVKAKSYTYTREQFEAFSDSNGFNPNITENLINRSFGLLTVGTATKYKWDDNTITDTYDEVFPIDVQSLPSGTTCVSFTVGVKVPYNTAYAQPDNVMAHLKSDTQTVITHTVEAPPDWSLNASGSIAHLYRYGIRLAAGVTPQENDLIYFTREAGALPYFGQLLPYSFRETNDIWLNAKNNEYLKENGTDYYTFENLYKISCAKEHVENFEDIKPTIKGMMNNESPAKHIDQILDVAFDQDDNNDLDASGEKYQHPYFFVKLAKTSLDNGYGFNLFDCAIDGQTMKLNMADGNCGGCTFEVVVKYQSDGMAYNPVGVFEQATTINGVTYPAGSPKRNLQTGDVLVNRKEDIQQDTSAAEVWIALKKDNETFGNYENGAEVVLPDNKRGENFIPEEGDSFTIINICLPYAYIVAAEQRLYHALLDYMEKNNPRTWSFSIKFSSIYYKKHYEFMDRWLYEASQIPFIYNGITRKYYVQSYSYKMSNTSALPEVTVELSEKAKKNNVYYPVPYNPNTEQYAEYYLQQQQKSLKKAVSNYISGLENANIEAGNIQVNGDVTLSNGTSLNAQITALNSQIFSNEKVLTPDNTWSKIKKAAEVENLFFDGLFKTSENKINAYQAVYRFAEDTSGKWVNLIFEFKSESGFVEIQQEIDVEEGRSYTFSFFAESEAETSVFAYLRYFDGNGTEVTVEETNTVYLETELNRYVLVENAPEDAVYAKLCFENATQDIGLSIHVERIMVLDQDLTTIDQAGNIVASSMFPSSFKHSTKDFLLQYGGSTQVQSDWNQLDSSAIDFIKNKPDSLQSNVRQIAAQSTTAISNLKDGDFVIVDISNGMSFIGITIDCYGNGYAKIIFNNSNNNNGCGFMVSSAKYNGSTPTHYFDLPNTTPSFSAKNIREFTIFFFTSNNETYVIIDNTKNYS